MAVIGNIGTYGTDAPLQKNYIGDAMANVEDAGFKYRQEQALKAKAKKEEEDAIIKDVSDWDGKFDPTVVGNQSIDDPLIRMAMKAKERASQITKQLYSPNLTTQQKIELMSERNKLKQSFDVANQTPKLIQEKVKSLQEGIKNGKYNPRDVDLMQNLAKQIESGKFELNYDQTGVPRVKIYETDETGKPIGVLKDTSLGDLVNAFEPKLAFNYETYKDNALKNVKPDEFGYQTGANVVTGTRLSEGNKVQAKTYAEVILNDPDKLYEAQYIFKETDPEKLRQKLEQDFITSIPTGQKQSLDTGYLNFGLAKKKADQEEVQSAVADFGPGRKDDFATTETVVFDKESNKNVHQKRNLVVSGDSVLPNMITFPENKLTFRNLGGANSGLNGGFVEGVTKDKKTGDWVVTGKALKEKGVKFKMPNGELLDLLSAQKKLESGETPEDVKSYLQAQMDSFSAGDNYGTFVRKIKPVEMSSIVLKTKFKTLGALDKALKEVNQGQEQSADQNSTQPKKIKSGDIIDGYIFLGGDPNNAKNWKKQ